MNLDTVIMIAVGIALAAPSLLSIIAYRLAERRDRLKSRSHTESSEEKINGSVERR